MVGRGLGLLTGGIFRSFEGEPGEREERGLFIDSNFRIISPSLRRKIPHYPQRVEI